MALYAGRIPIVKNWSDQFHAAFPPAPCVTRYTLASMLALLKRKFSLPLAAACLLVAFMALVWWQGWLLRLQVTAVGTLPADGNQQDVAQLQLHGFGHRDWSHIHATLNGQPALVNSVWPEPPRVSHLALITVESPVMPGIANLTVQSRGVFHPRRLSYRIRYTPTFSDGFSDGTPDFLRLHSQEDRNAFRDWFTLIAGLLYEHQPLPKGVDDCAGLLRYAYREALVAHDDRWLADAKADGLLYVMPPLPSIRQYHYPQTPLGLGLFRTSVGSFQPADLTSGVYAQFADAHTLMQANTHLISRDIHMARPGDLLFYRQLGQNSPYHSMIVTGPENNSENGRQTVVYHTGPIGKDKGEVRRMEMTDLLQHPDARWRPVPANPNFLGVYRWNILREDD